MNPSDDAPVEETVGDESAGSAKPADSPPDALSAVDLGEGEEEEGVEPEADPLALLTAERDEYLDALRRVQAEFENYKKRMIRQQTEYLERATEGLVLKLLPALDAIELGRSHVEADSDAGKALGSVAAALYEALGKEGLEKIEPLGQQFDPNESDAVMHEEAQEGQEDHEVVEVLRPGFKWKGRVVRPAMVKVRG
jgi:molecular chaperone GrpE